MSVLTSVGIMLLSMLVMALLQLVPGVFAIFSHYANGKYSRNKATDLATFFILGAESAVVVIFLSVYAILCATPAMTYVVDSELFGWIIAGVFIALALVVLGLYYRKSKGSELFIPRSFASNLRARLPGIKSRSDAFTMGLFSTVPELVITLPLYIIVAVTVMRLGETSPERAGMIMLFTLAAVAPLLIMHTVSHYRNMADYMRFRFRHKNFFRFMIALCYLLIAGLIIIGVVA